MQTRKDLVEMNANFLSENLDREIISKMRRHDFSDDVISSITKDSFDLALKKLTEKEGRENALKSIENLIDKKCLYKKEGAR